MIIGGHSNITWTFDLDHVIYIKLISVTFLFLPRYAFLLQYNILLFHSFLLDSLAANTWNICDNIHVVSRY